MNNNSVNGVTFGFGKANTENDKQTEEVSPVKESIANNVTEEPVEVRSDENEEFTDILFGRNRNSCRKRMQRKSASGITGKNRNA